MKFLQFQSLQNILNLRHAVTTREGGVSTSKFTSLNLAFHVGDDEKSVRENRNILANELGYKAENLVAAQQVHGAESEIISSAKSGGGAFDGKSAVPDCDALITAQPDTPVLIMVADCAPILLVDPTQKNLAVVHAGWRGAAAGIGSKALARMATEMGTNIKDVRAGIGPCLCEECLEIGEEVAAEIGGTSIVRKQHWQKPHLNLRGLIRDDLLAAGVVEDQIEAMLNCPRCEVETFFSHRGQNGQAGRFGLVAWWQS